MNHASLALLAVFAFASTSLAEDRPLTPDVSKLDDAKTWTLINVQATSSVEDGQPVAHLDPIGGNRKGSNFGLALVKGETFDTGTIEIDLKGNAPPDQSFLGVAFNVSDEKTYEAIYFRPFNFARDGFTHHAVQYIAQPTDPWDKLRKEKPGVYESKVDPVPDPSKWFHARIEITRKKVSVWFDDGKQPCLVVDRLSDSKPGKIGLWTDSKPAAFRNLKITPTQADGKG